MSDLSHQTTATALRPHTSNIFRAQQIFFTCQYRNLELLYLEIIVEVCLLGGLLDAGDDLLGDVILHLLALGVVLAQFGRLVQVVSDLVGPLGDVLGRGVGVQLGVLDGVDGVVDGGLVLGSLRVLVLDVVRQQEVQKLL